jgi:membrane protein YdbS with pleckstrin-like domain
MELLRQARLSGWTVALVNACVLVVVFVVLAVSPAPVTFPSSHWEAIILGAGAAVMLLANALVASVGAATEARRARPTRTDTAELRELRWYEDFEVVTQEEVLGVVAEVLGDRHGTPAALLVQYGWLGAHRFLVPLDDVRDVDEAARVITVGRDAEPQPAAS